MVPRGLASVPIAPDGVLDMDIEQAIERLKEYHPGYEPGDTATPGHSFYEAAKGLEFHECRCAFTDQAYGAGRFHEFVAVGPLGGLHFVGTGSRGRRRVISCGPNGYHKQTGTPVCQA
jgi:hypothetical protein